MVTELESDFLVCEVKWALGSMTTNKASGGDGIPAEILKILKDDAAHATHLENSAATSKLEKVCFIPIPKEGSAKECSNYHIIVLI